VSGDARAEVRWLREEVHSLRSSLAERERHEADMWRAYVELAQRLGQIQLARESVDPAALSTAPPVNGAAAEQGDVQCAASAASTETPQRKSIMRAINNSQLTVREKRQLLQSMRPPRTIDVVNPWASED
jgi:hypothetical protein